MYFSNSSTNNKTKQYNITYYDNMCNVRLNFKLIAYYCAEIMRLIQVYITH